MTDHVAVGFGLVMLMLGFLFGLIIGMAIVNDSWRADSVEVGAAEYILQGDEAVWQWKDTTDD